MVNWDDTASKQLLLTIIGLADVNTPSWDKVAEAMGDGYSVSAVKQQYHKLNREVRAKFGKEGDGDGETTPAKPKGRGKKAAAEKSGGKRKSKKDVEDDGVGGDSEDDEEASPTKKMKVKEEKVKEESGDDLA